MGGFRLADLIFTLFGSLLLLLLWIVVIKLQAIIVILRKMQKIKIKFLEESQNK